MASFDLDRTSGRYHIRFRYGNLPFKRSLQLADDREAERVCGVVEETIKDLKRGRLSMPPDAEPGAFLLSGGKNTGKLTVTPRVAMSLSELFDEYKLKIIGKDPSTRYTEDIHIVHLLRILGEKTLVESITLATVEVYITTRGKEVYSGRKISATTILKEIKTLPRGLTLLHYSASICYLVVMTQLPISFEDRDGGAAPWTTSLASAA
jgi:hypothetical protein